jgi:SAM-dependent methyltransferase
MKGIIIAAALLAALPGCPPPPPAAQERTPDVVYVGTPYDVVSRMLQLARIKKDEVIYDLGCGDGRMVILAAQKYGCRGKGYDIDPERVRTARANAKRNRVDHLVEIVEADLFKLDFSAAHVLSLYLLPDINDKLVPKFEKLRRGTRLVFHNYGLEGFEPDESIEVISNEDNASHTLFLYTLPLTPKKQ